MDKFISIVTVLLILAYIGFASWVIIKRKTIGGSIGASVGFLCGGFALIPIAGSIASFICWAVVVVLALIIIGALFGGG